MKSKFLLSVAIILAVSSLTACENRSQPKEKIEIIPKAQIAEPAVVPIATVEPVAEIYELTAYCTCVKCCGIWSEEHESRIGTDYKQLTASGTVPTEGRTIAVDTSIIPFGTEVLIDGELYIAEDTGSAIKGKIIDIYFDSHQEALEFGRQRGEVIINESQS